VVSTNDHWVGFVPFYAQYPYEVHVYPKRHLRLLTDLTFPEAAALMECLQGIVGMYDALFGFSLPYMMGMHQAPINGGDHTDFHFHVEFYPIHRSRYQLKYNASCETGAGVHGNPSLPEAKAAELREALQRATAGTAQTQSGWQ
jgi:UDPglucose--hexose-1-phosphate uridylyltransferase